MLKGAKNNNWNKFSTNVSFCYQSWRSGVNWVVVVIDIFVGEENDCVSGINVIVLPVDLSNFISFTVRSDLMSTDLSIIGDVVNKSLSCSCLVSVITKLSFWPEINFISENKYHCLRKQKKPI